MSELEKNSGFPLIGDKFPDMEVSTTHGIMNLPKYFKKKWFILFSHPADFYEEIRLNFKKYKLMLK